MRGYRLLKAKECVAEITADDGAAWFGPYLPAEFVLGNPAARDAALHAIQACIPHREFCRPASSALSFAATSPARGLSGRRSGCATEMILSMRGITSARGEVISAGTGCVCARWR